MAPRYSECVNFKHHGDRDVELQSWMHAKALHNRWVPGTISRTGVLQPGLNSQKSRRFQPGSIDAASSTSTSNQVWLGQGLLRVDRCPWFSGSDSESPRRSGVDSANLALRSRFVHRKLSAVHYARMHERSSPHRGSTPGPQIWTRLQRAYCSLAEHSSSSLAG